MSNSVKNSKIGIIASSIIIAGALITIALILWGSASGFGHMDNYMGGDNSHESGFSGAQLIVLIVALSILVVSVIFLLISQRRSDMNDRTAFHYSNASAKEETDVQTSMKPTAETKLSSTYDSEQLISRLLNGDEKKLYEIIANMGGEILQKDIVARKTFSKAKVTRLLDKLEGRGLIIRERYGLTNKVKLIK